MKTFNVHVTQEDIENGQKVKPRFCPVALAMKRTLKADASVSYQFAYITFRRFIVPDKKIGISLPLHVQEFIVDFDIERPVSPISFTVEV